MKRNRDLIWNVGSLAILGVSGILLNVLIGAYYDAATLGVFNQVMAVYVFFSQVSVGGIDRSALKVVAQHGHDERQRFDIFIGALLPTCLMSVIVSGLFFASRNAFAEFWQSPGVADGIAAATPGLFFFALNKVLLGVVNGFERMRSFAVFQSLRYLLILLGLWIGLQTGKPGAELPYVFTFAEQWLFLALAIDALIQHRGKPGGQLRHWARSHFDYGVRSLLSGVMLELNARVDIFMLGFYLDDRAVGIYSFAGMFAEGLFQLVTVLQNIYNPQLAKVTHAKDHEGLHRLIREGRRLAVPLIVGVGAVAIALYPTIVRLMTNKPEFLESWAPFAWLACGVIVSSPFLPFGQILLMAGFPGSHTLYMGFTVVMNVIGNALLIPIVGLSGAAAATAISFLGSIFVLKLLVRRKLAYKF